jgi:hypothetical protein
MMLATVLLHAHSSTPIAGLPFVPLVAEGPYVCRFDGLLWQVRFGDGTEVRVFPDMAGMHYIAGLLASRYRVVRALELVRRRTPDLSNTRSIVTTAEAGGATPRQAKPEPVVDTAALAAYHKRLAEIDEEIADAQERQLHSLVEKLQGERQGILDEVKQITRPGGRLRRLGTSPEEKARSSVKHAMTRAYETLAEGGMPELAAHLRTNIRTGKDCVYMPPPDFPSWTTQ